MKTLKIILILILFVNISKAQDHYYYYQGDKVSLELSYEKVYVKFKEGTSENQKRQIISSVPALQVPERGKSERLKDVSIVDISAKRSVSIVKDALLKLNQHKEVLVANPFVIYPSDTTFQGITEKFVVKLNSPSDFYELERIAEETKTIIFKQNEYEPSVYILIADKNSNGNALEMANYFHENGNFAFAKPNFLKFLKRNCSDDQYFGDQWALQNTGQQGGSSVADIQACQAWEITRGRDVIRTAVLDDGVDLNHPDLINNLAQGFDATGNGSNGAPQGDDAHGTACAGVIAASGNNNIGVTGIAPNTTIVPVRIAFTDENNSDCNPSTNPWITEDNWIADAINWAWNPNFGNADILSNSWGSTGSPTNQIDNAIDNAINNGRDGLGSLVFFATGNNGTSTLLYHASHPGVIAVGATTRNDVRASFSQYGSHDVVAPGAEIPTLDVSGNPGYSNSECATTYNGDPDYVSSIDGTSFACPYAAGTMALILSVNRCLTQNEAQQVLELSCDKVGNDCYNPTADHPNGTWNNEMGHGRINAHRAVQYAFSTQITNISTTGGTIESTTDLYNFQLLADGCLNLGIGIGGYLVKRAEVVKEITFPYTTSPLIIGHVTGMSINNPHIADPWFDVLAISPTSATLRTFIYDIRTLSNTQVGIFPESLPNIKWNLTVLSQMSENLFLQNETVSTGLITHNAMNTVESGYNVTNAVPNGNYVVEGDANVTLHAGNSITLKPGTIISPGPNGSFHAFVAPLFTCTQYPMGMVVNNDDDFPPVIKNYEVERLENSENLLASTDLNSLNKKSLSLTNYPNPFSNNTTIEYQIDKSEKVTIEIYDNCGRPIYKLKNKQQHEAGIYQVKLDGVNLASGTYYCTLTTENRVQTIELVVTK